MTTQVRFLPLVDIRFLCLVIDRNVPLQCSLDLPHVGRSVYCTKISPNFEQSIIWVYIYLFLDFPQRYSQSVGTKTCGTYSSFWFWKTPGLFLISRNLWDFVAAGLFMYWEMLGIAKPWMTRPAYSYFVDSVVTLTFLLQSTPSFESITKIQPPHLRSYWKHIDECVVEMM